MTFRLPPPDLCISQIAPFCTQHAARVVVPIETAIASKLLFADVRANLMCGDMVTLCQFDHKDHSARSQRMIALARLYITYAGNDGVEWRQDGDTVHFDPAREIVVPKAEPAPVLAELEVVTNEQGGYLAREVVSGHVHKHFKSKVAAERYVFDYGGKKAIAA